jgi:hypothetical protein
LFHGKGFKGHNGFDRTNLEKIITETGFVNVKFTTVYKIKKTGNDGVERTFPLFLVVAERSQLKFCECLKHTALAKFL